MKEEAAWPVTTVDLLRHGACADGAIIRGSTDSALSESGWQQMRDALQHQGGWQRVLSSPLLRCRSFATDFAARRQLPLELVPALRELDFGSWEGRRAETVQAEDPQLAERFFRQPGTVTPPGGEPLAAARERVANAWHSVLATYRGQQLLLITHGGTIQLLLSHLLDAPLGSCRFFAVPCACLLRLRVTHTPGGDYPQLLFQQPPLEPC